MGGVHIKTIKLKKSQIPVFLLKYFKLHKREPSWLLRNDIIWFKPNAMPSSVKDRLSNTYEHVFHFVKSRKYYYDLDSIRIKHKTSIKDLERRINADRKGATKTKKNLDKLLGGPQFSTKGKGYFYYGKLKDMGIKSEEFGSPRARTQRLRYKTKFEQSNYGQTLQGFTREQSIAKAREQSRIDAKKLFPNDLKNQQEYINYVHDHLGSPKGKNPGDFWSVTTKGYPEAHFAVFPEKLIIPIIKSSCPQWICKKCGKPRERLTDKSYEATRPGLKTGTGKSGTDLDPNKSLHKSDISKYRMQINYETIGWSDCGCKAGFKPGVVLDPFVGSGTTLEVAMKLGRNAIGFELNPMYEPLIKKRIKDDIKNIESYLGVE